MISELLAWVTRKSLRSRRLMAFLRRHPRLARMPLNGLPRLAVGYDEVTRVLSENRAFGVPYLRAMGRLKTPFVLGLPQSGDHTRQRAALKAALATAEAGLEGGSRLAAARALNHGHEIEIVHGLTDAVLERTVGATLGLGDGDRAQLDKARDVFRDIFINPTGLKGVRVAADGSGAALRRHVAYQVRERRGRLADGEPPGPNVLDQLLVAAGEPRLKEEEIASQVVGLFVAWVASVSRAMAYAVDAILSDPALEGRAHAAADMAAMWEVLLAAMYAQPPVPAIERRCERADRISGKPVACESKPWVALTAVLQDPEFPARLAAETRPGAEHLPFGFGMHQCIGIGISATQMSAIALELFGRGNVRRASSLKLAGPYPDRLLVTYGDR